MDCGTPFCNNGCPVNNIIPDFNDLVYHGDWKSAIDGAAQHQQLPRVHRPHLPRTLRGGLRAQRERRRGGHQVHRARHHRPRLGRRLGAAAPAKHKTGKKVAVVGAGPAGMAAAQQLARAGHDVTLFEKNDRVGGLLRYGIPDFKMEKSHIDRRVEQMQAEGVSSAPACWWAARTAGQGLQGHQLGQGNRHARAAAKRL
jgi:glutamate synthase (NADPH/NADH) small chain